MLGRRQKRQSRNLWRNRRVKKPLSSRENVLLAVEKLGSVDAAIEFYKKEIEESGKRADWFRRRRPKAFDGVRQVEEVLVANYKLIIVELEKMKSGGE